jgi:rSAM/selenodomain-associated transferase 2
MKISVIIPTLNEEKHLARLISSIKKQAGDFEIIVADGGSTDRTVKIAQSNDATVVKSRAGRAVQMNAGAKCARGDALLFLHADSLLPPGAFSAIEEKMKDRRMAGGTFSLAFDYDHPLLNLYAACSRFKFRFFHYGDQGIFVRRSLFEMLNGYKEIPIMEDLELLYRISRTGKRALIKLPITTSARRFLSNGIFRQEFMNVLFVILYLLGVKPERLKRWYDKIK